MKMVLLNLGAVHVSSVVLGDIGYGWVQSRQEFQSTEVGGPQLTVIGKTSKVQLLFTCFRYLMRKGKIDTA